MTKKIFLLVSFLLLIQTVYAAQDFWAEAEIEEQDLGHSLSIMFYSNEKIDYPIDYIVTMPVIKKIGGDTYYQKGQFIPNLYVPTLSRTQPMHGLRLQLDPLRTEDIQDYPAGEYDVIIQYNPDEQVFEENKENNKRVLKVNLSSGPINKVEVTGGHDITVFNAKIDRGVIAYGHPELIKKKLKVLTEESIGIHYYFKNRGDTIINDTEFDIEIPEINYKFSYRTPNFFDKIVRAIFKRNAPKDDFESIEEGAQIGTSIGAGQIQGFTLDNTIDYVRIFNKKHLNYADFKEQGIYTLKITLDPDNKINEVDEENNVYVQKFEVYPLPSEINEYSNDNFQKSTDLYMQANNLFKETKFEEGLKLCNQIRLNEFSEGCYGQYIIIKSVKTGEIDSEFCHKISDRTKKSVNRAFRKNVC